MVQLSVSLHIDTNVPKCLPLYRIVNTYCVLLRAYRNTYGIVFFPYRPSPNEYTRTPQHTWCCDIDSIINKFKKWYKATRMDMFLRDILLKQLPILSMEINFMKKALFPCCGEFQPTSIKTTLTQGIKYLFIAKINFRLVSNYFGELCDKIYLTLLHIFVTLLAIKC